MQLSRSIVIDKAKEEVWKFLAEPQNISKWDRGVRAVEAGQTGVLPTQSFEFTTVVYDAASQHGRMTYRIGQTDPNAGCRVDLISCDGNARYFKSAYWLFRVAELPDDRATRRSRVECLVHFDMRLRYVWLALILFLMRSALQRDLIGLKRVLESA